MEGLSKGIANAGIKNRIKQIIVLLTVIFIGILISQAVQAQSYHKAKARHYKSKYKTQIKTNHRACNILERKRTEEPKTAVAIFSRRKPKYKPQAEVDAPTAMLSRKEGSNW